MSEYLAEDNDPPFEVEICVVKSPGRFGYQSIYRRKELDESSDMTRISNFVTLIFLPRKVEEIVPEMVAKIEEEIKQSHIQHAESIQRLESRKKDLLSLTYSRRPPEDQNFEDDIPF